MRRRRIALASLGLLVLAGATIGHLALTRALYIEDEGSARWLVADTVRFHGTYRIKPRAGGFRTTFRIGAPAPPVTLTVRAVERAQVELDGEPIYVDAEPDSRGRVARKIPLGVLREGEHVLTIYVLASTSPPLLWAQSDVPLVATGAGWQSASDGSEGAWRAARFATDAPEPFPVSRQFPHARTAFVRVLPALLPLFLVVVMLEVRGRPRPTPSQLRWALLAVWCGLAANNLIRVPAHLGMDLRAHLAYVVYLLEHMRIPLATEGDEMMQAPLAYLLYAPLFVAFSQFLDADGVVQGLRILPMACGAAQVELCYRAVARVYPDRADVQRAGILVGGLLPVNIYLAHAVANEPVVALFGGAVAVATLDMATLPGPPPRSRLVGAGLLLGLALLSKVTAVLLAPALLGAVALRAYGSDRGARRALRDLAVVAGCAALVSGWYYARNWVLLGSPFLGTWRPDVLAAWWQEPGYRSASQYLGFGEALAYPVYAAVVGLWDGLYASLWLDGWISGAISRASGPPWNESPLLAGAWLGLVPSLALGIGAVGALWQGGRPQTRLCQRIALGTVALYLCAVLYLHLTVPYYCISKASYLAATTPLLAVLAAGGFSWFARVPALRAVGTAALVCWAANVVAAYWVV